MSTFRVTFTQTVNASIDVEADTPTQAMASAEESLYVSLCHQCSAEVDLDPGGWEPHSAAEVSS